MSKSEQPEGFSVRISEGRERLAPPSQTRCFTEKKPAFVRFLDGLRRRGFVRLRER